MLQQEYEWKKYFAQLFSADIVIDQGFHAKVK